MKNFDLGRPFRWNLTRGDRIGSLVGEFTDPVTDDEESLRAHERYQHCLSYTDELVECAAQVLARSADSDLYFVGRSPDSIFDLLSGVLYDTPDLDRLHRLPLSLYGMESTRVTTEDRAWLRGHLTAHGLTPKSLASRSRKVALCDLVASGSTFENLYHELRDWIEEQRAPWNIIRTRIRFLGITPQGHTSPKTWRWHQHADWVRDLPPRAVRNVSLDRGVWRHLAVGCEPKTADSFHHKRWNDPGAAAPRHDREARLALAVAVGMVEYGRTRDARAEAHRLLTGEPTFREPWLRSLAGRLKASGGAR